MSYIFTISSYAHHFDGNVSDLHAYLINSPVNFGLDIIVKKILQPANSMSQIIIVQKIIEMKHKIVLAHIKDKSFVCGLVGEIL